MPEAQKVGAEGSSIVPRWEWRVFGPELPLAPDRLGEAVSGPERKSAETYLLSPSSPHNVKIRGGALEVKRLEEVHVSGLERWRPTLRAPFPLDPEVLTEVWDALRIPAPRSTIPLTDESAFLSALPPAIRAVALEKRRRPLTLRGCPGEWVTLTVGEVHWQSLALEHADPEQLLDTLRWFHLPSAANTNYPRALAQIVGGQTPACISGA